MKQLKDRVYGIWWHDFAVGRLFKKARNRNTKYYVSIRELFQKYGLKFKEVKKRR